MDMDFRIGAVTRRFCYVVQRLLRAETDLTPCCGRSYCGRGFDGQIGSPAMPTEVNGTRYSSTTEVAKRAGVSRQTVWRWRRDGRIPPGRRYRNGQVLFTEDEAARIEEYANRLEPSDDGLRD